MGKRGFIALVLMAAGGALWGGCRAGSAVRVAGGVPGPAEAKIAEVADEGAGLAAYLTESAPSSRTFQQFETGRRGSPPRAYEREVQAQGRVEGSLIGRVEFPLWQYLDPHSRGGKRPRVEWPRAERGTGDAFFIEFRPAIMEWPVEGREGEAVTARAQLTAYERDGTPFAYGNCRRTMRVAGFETIRAGERDFEDAVRMEADTDLSFGWLATMRVHETAWFARGVGLVRREERFSGRALWLFRFSGAGRYELADEVAERVEMVADNAGGRAKGGSGLTNAKDEAGALEGGARSAQEGYWARLAICFERNGRRIRVSGLAVEWAGLEQP